MSLKIFWVVDIEAGINIFKGSFRRKGRGIDKLIVRPVNHISDVYKRQDGKPVTEEKEVTIPAYKVVSVFDVSRPRERNCRTLPLTN